MEVNQLPTKPGPYYWRESDGHEWDRVFEVQFSHSMGLCVSAGFYYESVQQRGGQWLPIPTPEEVLELLWRVHNVLDDPSTIELRHLGEYVNKLRKGMELDD